VSAKYAGQLEIRNDGVLSGSLAGLERIGFCRENRIGADKIGA
jgi:hypothetical protein